jgi:hypothetical protein
MSVYTRHDSPFYWLYIPPRRDHGKPDGKAVRERTNILATPANRPLADRLFESRMHALAVSSHFSIPPQPRTRGKMAGWAYVYFVTDGEQVKIGHAVDAANRLRSLQCSHTRPLTILATLLAHVSVERLIHRKFHHLRTRGEWFRQAPELQEFIEMVRAGRDVVSGLLAPYTLPRSRGVHGRVRPFHNKAMKMEQSG